MRYCGQCGAQNTDTARFCTNCGSKLSEVQPAPVASGDVGVNGDDGEVVNISAGGAVTTEAYTGTVMQPDDKVETDAVSSVILSQAALSEAEAMAQQAQMAAAQAAQAAAGGQTAPVSANADKITALSIVAFVFSFFVPIAGLIMGIIDLCINDGRKKGLSIAAVAISACIIAIGIVSLLVVIIPLSTMMGTL